MAKRRPTVINFEWEAPVLRYGLSQNRQDWERCCAGFSTPRVEEATRASLRHPLLWLWCIDM